MDDENFSVERIQPRSKTVIYEQKRMLYNFMKTHPFLSRGKFSRNFSHKSAQKLWMELTDMLNAVPEGSQKNWRQWRKVWQDLRWREKKTKRYFNRHAVEQLESKIEIVIPKLEPLEEEGEESNGDFGDSVSSTSTNRPMPPLYSSNHIAPANPVPVPMSMPPPLALIEPPRLIPLTPSTSKSIPKVIETPQNTEKQEKEYKFKEELLNVKWAKVNAMERIAAALEQIANKNCDLVDPVATG